VSSALLQLWSKPRGRPAATRGLWSNSYCERPGGRPSPSRWFAATWPAIPLAATSNAKWGLKVRGAVKQPRCVAYLSLGQPRFHGHSFARPSILVLPARLPRNRNLRSNIPENQPSLHHPPPWSSLPQRLSDLSQLLLPALLTCRRLRVVCRRLAPSLTPDITSSLESEGRKGTIQSFVCLAASPSVFWPSVEVLCFLAVICMLCLLNSTLHPVFPPFSSSIFRQSFSTEPLSSGLFIGGLRSHNHLVVTQASKPALRQAALSGAQTEALHRTACKSQSQGQSSVVVMRGHYRALAGRGGW
jgi:hypothetical protein